MSISSTKKNGYMVVRYVLSVFLVLIISILCGLAPADVNGKQQGISETKLGEFAQNDILFYNPGECVSTSRFGSICGDTPKEKYWSALRKELDEIHTAAVFGSIDHEGSFGTARWEIGVIVDRDGGNFIRSWDSLYNCDPGNCPGGVGAFGITYTLGPYLRNINDENPDLLKYFKDPSNYSFPGDETLERVGDVDYDRLVEQEVNYVLNEADIESFKAMSSLEEAADWWTMNYENCSDCCGGADYDKSCEQLSVRRASAQKEYDEMKDFSCTASSSSGSSNGSSSVISGNDITWIGDSYSENSTNKAAVEAKYSGIYYDGKSGRMFANDSERWGSSGLNIIKNDVKENLRDYLVFALGTNIDAGSKDAMADNIDDLVATAKKYNSNAKIVLVTPITNNDSARSTYDAYHEAMQEAAEKYDNVILADWYDFAKDHLNEYFDDHVVSGYSDNSTHPNSKGYEKWIGVISDALSSAKNDGCGGDTNPVVTVDGTEYMFPLSGASKDNYLHGTDETSMLSPMPCSNYSVGACHHDYVALDLGLRREKVDGQEKTDADYSDINYDDYYYYSDGIKVLAFVEGEVTYAGYYSNGVPNGYGDKCGQLMYKGVDGNEYWLGHLAYNDSIKAGDKFKLGDVIGEVGPPPCAQGTQSHLHIHISPDSSNNTELYDIMNAAYEALPETKTSSGSSSDCANVCTDSGNGTGFSGYSNTEDAEEKIIADYMSMSSSELSKYGLLLPDTGDYHDNCVAFSTWFINNYTEISYTSPPNGNMLVDDFYSKSKEDYPDLVIEKEPSVYSVASWSVPTLGTNSGNHTGIVVGIDKESDTILIAEAGWNNPGFTGVHSYKLSDASGDVGYQYINLNKYLKTNAGLK